MSHLRLNNEIWTKKPKSYYQNSSDKEIGRKLLESETVDYNLSCTDPWGIDSVKTKWPAKWDRILKYQTDLNDWGDEMRWEMIKKRGKRCRQTNANRVKQPNSLPCLTNTWLTSRSISHPSMIILSTAKFFRKFSVSLTWNKILFVYSCIIVYPLQENLSRGRSKSNCSP